MRAQRSVTAILFTDIVDSTVRAAELGDREWRKLQSEHHTHVRRELRRFGGREANTAGDGFLAAFDRPASAIRCAAAIRESLKELGLEIRAGVHAGEVDGSGRDLGGLGVHVGARVAAAADPGEVLVSGTVRELVVGSGFEFADRGERELKGVPGRWRLYALTGLPPGPALRTGRWIPELNVRTTGLIAGALVLLLAALVVGRLDWIGGRGSSTSADVSTSVIATMPFTVRGSDDVAYLGEGMVNLLGTKLDGAGDLRSVDSRALIGAIARNGSGELDPDRAAELAGSFGAGLYVLGEIVEAGNRLRIDATLYRTDTAQSMAEASAEGAAEDVFAMVDEIAAGILGNLDGDPGARVDRIAAVTTSSLPALKAYLNGERAFRAGEYGAATEAFQRAVDEDSLFALAYYRLAAAAEYSALRGDIPMWATEKALQHSDRLSARDRTLLDASLAFRRGDADEGEKLYRSYLGRYPDDVQAWFDLGEILYHLNILRGRPPTEAREAFGRVLDFEPDNAAAMLHLIRLEAGEGRIAAMDSLVDRYMTIAGEGERALEVLAIQAFAHGDVTREGEVLSALRTAPDITLLLAVANGSLYGATTASRAGAAGGPDDWERLIRLMTEPSRSPRIRGQGYLWLGCVRLATGRWKEARQELDRARGLAAPALETYYRSILRLLPFVPTTDDEIEALLDEARVLLIQPGAGDVDPTVDHQGVEPFVRSYLVGLLGSRLGRADLARSSAAELERMGGTPDAGTLGPDLARAIEGYDAWRKHESERAIERFEAMELNVAYPMTFASELYTLAFPRFLRAISLQETGRGEEAIGWLATLETSPYELVFRAPSHLHRAQIYEQSGDRERAIEHYRAFVELWSDADPELQPTVEQARAALARLER
ncbi:MAG TPA: tetratricopeptide repeat protein [Gemmatimonadota bacterium]|nr:tetratricopeptide repeat protein [Gemmatimonadota bacterium]